MRRWVWVMAAVVIIAIVVAVIIAAQPKSSQATAPSDTDTVVVARKQLVASVSASGSILPVVQVSLNFSAPGTVAEVLVKEGDTVRQGAVLAQLDTAESELALQQAEQALLMQQVAYSQTVAPKQADLDAAKAALTSARANLQALTTSDPLQLDIARRQADVANESRYQVELRWNQVKDAPVGGLGRDLLQSQYAQAVLQAQIADLQYQIVARGGSEAQLAAARAQVAQTQASLDRLVGDDRSLRLAGAQLRQAELNVALAQARLDHAGLTAAFDGTVAEVNIVAGQNATAALQPAIVLADLSSFHIDVGVDEIDVGKLAGGQDAQLSVDALPGVPIHGRVERIAPTARESAGVVSYVVTVALDPTDAPIRAGMSAIVEIITEVRDNALVIPNRFIRIDRVTGRAYVTLKRGDQTEEVEIITGLRNDAESEVLQGLSEGDTLIILPGGLRLPFGG